MSEIYRVYTSEQLLEFARNKILADDVGITNFNVGSNTRSELEALCDIASMIQMDTKGALLQLIPVMLYEGFHFTRKAATNAIGHVRFGRKPVFYFRYRGTASEALLTITDTAFTITVPGQPAHTISIDFATYATVADIITELNAHPMYEAELVGNGSILGSELYHYTNKNCVGTYNYQNESGCDVLTNSAVLIPIVPSQISADDLVFLTTESGEIPAGEASSPPVAIYCTTPGKAGNITPYAIDTQNGNGYLQNSTSGVEFVVNDSSLYQGSDQETDAERKYRFELFIQGLGGHTEAGWEAAILGIDGVKSVTIRPRYPQPGINQVIADDGTGNLSSELVTEIYKVIDGDPNDRDAYPGCGVAGISAQVVAPTVLPVQVECILYKLFSINVDTAAIIDNVRVVIEQYINTRKLGQDVILSELQRLIKNEHAAIYDLDILLPVQSVTVGVDTIPRTGSGVGLPVTVTMQTRMEP